MTVCEASRDMFECLTDALSMGGCKNITAHHAVVGQSSDVWGELDDADHVFPTNLSACDVLHLDYEGAEPDILAALSEWPPEVVGDTRSVHDAPTGDIIELLDERRTPSARFATNPRGNLPP